MDRRRFFGVSGVGALALTASATASVGLAQNRPSAGKPSPSKLKLGCQSGPSTDQHFAYLARYGVTNVNAGVPQADPTRLTPTVDELRALKEMAQRHGLGLDLVNSVQLPSSHIDRERNPAIMLAQSPQRDRDIESFQNFIRNCAAAGIPGIKYNMSILGVVRTASTKGRGDAVYSSWDLASAKPNPALTRAGVVTTDQMWERITYFLDRVVPVANEYKVRLACHPHDPGMPPEGYQGVDRVLGRIDGLKKFITINESPYHGLNFCQGTVSEALANPGKEIFDVIRYFGSRKKIFNVHFRNIRGGRNKFVETFPDEGDVNMLQAALTYKEVGYDGMLMPDHVPTVPIGANAYRYGGDVVATDDGHLESFAFAYGYIRGIIQAVNQLG
jgi:mannonate dehydratase